MKDNYFLSVRIIFVVEILTLLVFINSLSFYVLEEAKENEKSSSKSSILSFTIKGGVDQSFNEDIFFKIKTEIYKENKYLSEKNAECTIPKNPDAKFGTSVIANCEIDLLSTDNPNKIKFISIISNNNKFQLNDINNYVLEKVLSFTKKIETKPDIEFTAASIKTIKCDYNKFIFGIKGDINKYWINSFTFDINLNENNSIKAKCVCPNVIFNSEITINCTITISTDNDFMENLKKGIILKENFYKITDKDAEKLLKFKIKNDKETIELKDFNCNPDNNEEKDVDYSNYSKKSNRGKNENEYKRDEDSNKYKEEESAQSRWEREQEEEKRKRREREEREREEEKKKKAQDDLEKFLKQRQKEREEEEKKRKYNDYDDDNNQNLRKKNYDNNDNNNYYNQRNNNNDDDIIDYNSNVKLIHIQVRYSYGFIYYMFYALTPVPLGHKIKARFSIKKYNYDTGYNDQENKYIILKTEEEINPNDKNIIIEYIAKYECQQCKQIILDKNNIQGAKIYNIPEEQYQLDAVAVNQNNYLTKSKMESPPLYIVDNIFNQNCMINLNGNFFNKNKFFIAKFPLTLIKSSNYGGSGSNITVYCGLNERGVFACPITDNMEIFEYKLEPLIIDKKENIIIDNTYLAKSGIVNQVSCKVVGVPKIGLSQNNNDDQLKENPVKKMSTTKKIIIGIVVIIILYYLISKCCCPKEEEEFTDDYNPKWRVSSSNYGGETYGLRNRW